MPPSNEKRKLDNEASSTSAPTAPAPDKRQRVIGPSLPPPTQDNKDNSVDSDSSDDDDFGPSLPPPEGTAPASTSAGAPEQEQQEQEPEPESKPRRDEWMLAPPESSDWSSKVDPTKLRNRKFQSGKAASGAAGKGGIDSAWTETPEEKLKRLQDSVLGVETGGSGGGSGAGEQEEIAKRKNDEKMRERVRKYNEATRKETESKEKEAKKSANGKKEEDDDPSARAFDKEKDMGLGSRISASQRREMINKAGDFGSRFTKGRFL